MSVPKRVVVVGDDSSGKTALINAICLNPYSEKREPTTWERYQRLVEMKDGEKLLLIMTDTAGDDEFVQLRPPVYRLANPDVILLCFSIEDEETLHSIVDKWKPELHHYCPEVPIVLTGNKKDLRSDSLSTSSKKLVTSDQGKNTAVEIRAPYYIECSAKTGENIPEVTQAIFVTSDRMLSFTSLQDQDEDRVEVKMLEVKTGEKGKWTKGKARIKKLCQCKKCWLLYMKAMSIVAPFLLLLNLISNVLENLNTFGVLPSHHVHDIIHIMDNHSIEKHLG